MNKIYFIIISALILLFAACKKEESSPNSATSTSLDGFGNRGGTPSGSSFHFPSYITLASPVQWGSGNFSDYEVHGVGNILLDLSLKNTMKANVTMTLPAGLIFVSNNDSSQSGLSICPTTLTFSPYESKNVMLRCFCMNHDKNTYRQTVYDKSVISDNDQVVKLINAVKVKSRIVLLYHINKLGDIVWDISDGPGLTVADLDSIQSW